MHSCKFHAMWLKRISPNSKFWTNSVRSVFDESGTWVKKYKKTTRIELERYWIKQLSEKWKQTMKKSSTAISNSKKKFYCLSMFPYPSGKLHMGHVRVYTISDTMAHYHRMQGKEVIHPMGWDSFGLPAENAALINNLDPAEWTKENIAYMKQQLIDLNLFFDWPRELSTSSPEYYRWTQYLFVRMFKAGLAYQKKAFVNWDPVDRTVLANEQVDDEGKSWRSGATVEKRLLKQWFLKTTAYTESLLKSIDEIEEQVGIKAMQRHWIGEAEGWFVDFKLEIDGVASEESISVFCSHPEHIDRASHINLLPVHAEELTLIFNDAGATMDAADLKAVKDGRVISEVAAINPFTNNKIPFVLSDHYGEEYKSSTVLGIPSVNGTDASIAAMNGLLCGSYNKQLSREDALEKIKSLGCGHGHMTSSGLRDWLISRQRRWGTPIPVIHCPVHGAVVTPEKDLPVLLPKYKEDLEEWKETVCPECGRAAVRETDTIDTFVDSTWYFMRFTDPHNENEIFSKSKCDDIMPVDLYIGGIEHAILHLYFARFISHFSADIGLTEHREPFKKILAQGIIKGKTYRLKSSRKYLTSDDVTENDAGAVEKSTGEAVEVSFEKMSKSKLNGVDPQGFVSEWGISMTRLFVLYAAAPSEVILWDTKTDVIPGMMRWQMKLWRNVDRLLKARESPLSECQDYESEFNLAMQTNRTIEQVTHHFENSNILSAAITYLMTLARFTTNIKDEVIISSQEFERSICAQIIMSAPMMPHFASELWSGLRSMKYKLTDHDWDRDVLSQSWPKVCERAHRPVDVWVNDRRCVKLYLPPDFDDKGLAEYALANPKVYKRIKHSVSEVIVKPNYVKFLTSKEEVAA